MLGGREKVRTGTAGSTAGARARSFAGCCASAVSVGGRVTVYRQVSGVSTPARRLWLGARPGRAPCLQRTVLATQQDAAPLHCFEAQTNPCARSWTQGVPSGQDQLARSGAKSASRKAITRSKAVLGRCTVVGTPECGKGPFPAALTDTLPIRRETPPTIIYHPGASRSSHRGSGVTSERRWGRVWVALFLCVMTVAEALVAV